MAESDEERDAKNQRLIHELRETFARATEQLTPDVEPATVYLLSTATQAGE